MELGERKIGHSRVLYLSPLVLEDDEPQIAVFVVVHELLFIRQEDDQPQEKEANTLIKEWRFTKEHDEFFRLMKGDTGD